MKLEGWKARFVLTAAILIILDFIVVLPLVIALTFVHH